MGSVFRKQITRPVPAGAEVVTRDGRRYARWRVRGKLRTAPLTAGEGGADRIVTESATYFAKYRGPDGLPVVRPTGCRDKASADQVLARWEREAEQVRAGTLDPRALDAARRAAAPVADHLADFDQSLAAAGRSAVYRANIRRAVTRVARECGFVSLADVRREAVEGWLAARAGDGMGARTRNYYREAVVAFVNWCRDAGRLLAHDLGRLPVADARADPRRRRRALTDDELRRLLVVAAARPLADARTVRRGPRRGQAVAEVRPEVAARLGRLGEERALIYKTLVLTGLRVDELRTLTVGQLDLTPGAELLRLDPAREKNREGNAVPIRADLADDLRGWLARRLAERRAAADAAEEPPPDRLPGGERLFTVPTGLRLILDRDLRAAGVPKRDDRGRTVDVHAMRTTFGTMLSRAGVAPRTAQEAMRHSDIKLTMGVYTDPRLLDVRGAVEKLPAFPVVGGEEPPAAGGAESGAGSSAGGGTNVAPVVAPTVFRSVQLLSLTDAEAGSDRTADPAGGLDVSASRVNEKTPVSSADNTGVGVGLTGFEPATSWSRSQPSDSLQGVESLKHPAL